MRFSRTVTKRVWDEIYGELKAETEAIQQQMVEAKKNKCANALKEIKRMFKEFVFIAGMHKGSLAEGRKKS